MAGLLISIKPASLVIPTGTGPRTIFQVIAPANQRIFLPEVIFSFNGITAADPPVLIEALYQTTAGTSASLTVNRWNDGDPESPQTTALQTFSGTEPTAGNIIWGDYIHTQTGDRDQPVDFRCPGFIVGGGKRLGFRFTSLTVTGTVNCQAFARGEE